MRINELVLVAEDDLDAIFLYERTFKKIDLPNYRIVRNGEEAIEYLCGTGRYSDRHAHPFPDWLILDLKMPRKDGLEVLQWLQENPSCNVVPSVMISASSENKDVRRAYELGVNAFFVKPSALEELAHILRTIKQFWNLAELPHANPMLVCK
jgi:CheY-like chemotaxis protein